MLAHAFTLGRRLGKLTVAFDVAGLRFAEAPARSGFFEREQHDAVVRALPDYAQPVAVAGYETGWRINELLSRECRHVDLNAGTLRLDPGETKNGDGRTFPLTGDLLAALRAQRAREGPGEGTRPDHPARVPVLRGALPRPARRRLRQGVGDGL